jgi:hypothetical protein
VKNHKNANNSTTTKAREKIIPYLESLEFYKVTKKIKFCEYGPNNEH